MPAGNMERTSTRYGDITINDGSPTRSVGRSVGLSVGLSVDRLTIAARLGCEEQEARTRTPNTGYPVGDGERIPPGPQYDGRTGDEEMDEQTS